MLSSTASLPSPARNGNSATTKESTLRERNRNLFDLLLDETYPWEALHDEHKDLAIQILARLIAQAVLGHQEREKNRE
jgi:hypothetical protein